MLDGSPLIYGANGYTGELIARQAVKVGLRPILAGRRREPLENLARELPCELRVFDLDRPPTQSLDGVAVVLNCAGPFRHTAAPMMEACLAAGAHYLDITGEIGVIELAASLDARAREARVAIVPAVGFDVVPTDCLAAMLADRLAGGQRLELAFAGTGGYSPGTLKTMLEGLPEGGRARIDGRIQRVPVAWKTKQIPFRDGVKAAITIPWGDVASAYYSTRIPNIEVYLALPGAQIRWLRGLRYMMPVLRLAPVRKWLTGQVARRVKGPSEAQRKRGRSAFWGQVTSGTRAVTATMETASGYQLTVLTAVEALARTLAGAVPPGFHTPSQAFGKEFILSMPDTEFRWERSFETEKF